MHVGCADIIFDSCARAWRQLTGPGGSIQLSPSPVEAALHGANIPIWLSSPAWGPHDVGRAGDSMRAAFPATQGGKQAEQGDPGAVVSPGWELRYGWVRPASPDGRVVLLGEEEALQGRAF